MNNHLVNILCYLLLWNLLLLSACQNTTDTTGQAAAYQAARTDTLRIGSTAMGQTIEALVFLLESYFKFAKENYPVTYLLHGAYGDHKNWLDNVPELKKYAEQYQMILVFPNGGQNSWYMDSPVDSSFLYETHITRELLQTVDSTYRTIAKSEGRAISGLSMGGHGALYLAARNPTLYGAAGSMSGGLDLRPYPNDWNIADRLGSIEDYPDRWANNSVINHVDSFSSNPIPLIIDCGVDDFFLEVNQATHRALLKKGVPHDYIIRPGEHNWDYWKNAVAYQLLFFDRFFD